MNKLEDIMRKSQSRKAQLGCPRHGKEWMVVEGGAVYCGATVTFIDGRISKCFHHPSLTNKARKQYYSAKKSNPNIMKILFKKRKKRKTNNNKDKSKRRKYNKSGLQKMNTLMRMQLEAKKEEE